MKNTIVKESKYVRMVVCSLTAALCIGSAWGKGVNPAYKKWIRRQCDPDRQTVSTNSEKTVSKPSKRLLSTPGDIVSVNDVTGLERLSAEDNFGYKPSLIDYSYLSIVNIRSQRLNSSESLPRQYDSRDKGWITTVKDQNPFGTCWAHAAIGAVEAAVRREHPDSYSNSAQPDFSENNMVMQNWHDFHPYGQKDYITGQPSEYSAGGFFETAFAYLGRWGGPILESEDPYPTAANSYSTHGNDIVKPSAFNVTGYIKYAPKTSALDHDEIKRAIIKYGGIWVSYCATESENVNDGSGTIYTFPYISSDRKSFYNWCSQVFGEKNGSNHAVLLVGWDDDYSRDNFTFYSSPSKYRMPVPPGDGAYLIKNSWGTGQFDNGYLWVSYYDDNMLYDDSYAIPIVESTDNYSEIYQHDPLGLVYPFPDSAYQWGANIFTATDNGKLSAVGFYSMSPQTAYTIKVYTGVSSANPISGTCQTGDGKVGTVADAGFAMIKLDNPVSLTKGQRFSVVLKLESPGCDEPFGTEVNLIYKTDWWSKYKTLKRFSYSLTSRATAEPGQSFVSKNGASGTWRDITTDISPITVEKDGYFLTINGQNIYDEVLYDTSSANLCIKAYTEVGNPTTELTGIEITGDKTSITSGGTVSLSCTASYNNVSPKDVTNKASWSIVAGKGDDVAEVVAPGVIKTSSIFETKLVSVLAMYEEDGISKSDTWDFYVTIAAPSVPTGVAASQGTETSCVRVNWVAPSGATEYSVYRATANNSNNAQYLDKVTVAKYNDTSAVPGVDYWYFIKARNSSGTSEFSTGAMGWRKLAPPDNVTATVDLIDKVSITWSKVEGAFCYQVYRADSESVSPKSISSKMVKWNYDDTSAETGKQYYYYVLAMTDSSNSRNSGLSDSVIGRRAVPVTVDYLELKGDASVAAGGYADYTADVIYTDGHKVENITPGSWSIVGDGASVANGRVTAATVIENKLVVLRANYTESGKTVSGEKQITISAVKPVAPRNVAANATETGVTVTWSTVAGAATYRVYRDDEPVGSVSAATFTDTSATPGNTYSYTVSAANSAGESARSASVSAMIPLAAPTGVKTSTDDATAVRISWLGVNGATYYRVARAPSDEGEKVELGTWQVGAAYSDTTATPGTEYYYFVRASIDSSASVVSAWSDGVIGKIPYEAPTLQTLVIGGPERIAASGTGAYSCAALYSDGNKENVSPSWSLSATSAATIDSSGVISAKAVTSDAKVTVTAYYGGLQTSREVVIVAPLPEASATVSNISVVPRWPFSTKVDIDYTLDTSPSGTRALVALSGYDNDHRKEMPAITIAGDSANQAVLAGRHRLTWDVGVDYPGFHAKSFDVNLKAEPYVIPSVTGIQTGETSTRGVLLSWEGVEIATAYEVWRSTSMSVNNATNVFSVTNVTECLDSSAIPGTIYFYWLKTVTPYGTGDFSSEYAFGYRQKVSVAVTFDANGGTLSGASTSSYTAGDQYKSLPSPTRTGYDFAGWWTLATAGVQMGATSVVDENITTLYAHWTPHAYTIHFDPNGGLGTMSDMSLTYGIATNLTTNVFVKAAYMFAGWTTNLSQVCYEDGASVINLSAKHEDVVVLCAMWSPAAPSDVNASDAISTDFISVSWSPVVDAIAYEIWRHDEDGNNVTNIASVVALGYEDTSATPGQTYYYSVRAIFQNSVGELSAEDVGCRKLLTPSLSASQGDDWNRVVLTTGELPIGTPLTVRVEIWRSESPSISSAEQIGTVSGGQRYYDSNVIAGNNYYYWARLYYGENDVSKSDFSPCVVGYVSEVSSVYISGAETLTPDGQACYRLKATCNDGKVREFPGTVSYGFQDRYGLVNFRSAFMTPGDMSIESSSYLMWLTITNANIATSRTITLTATSIYKDVTRTVSKSVTIKPKPSNFPYGYAVASSGLVALTGYSGTDTIITVPSQINGMTIAELAGTFKFDKVGIKSVSLPSSLQIIGGRAFYLCKSLTSISIPSSVTTISGSAFTGTALTSITIPSTVTSISEAAFDYACRLQSINVDSRNTKYSSSSGVLFNKDMTTLIAYPPAKSDKTYNIPDGVTYISSYSSGFHACFNLTSITLPNSLTGIYTGQVFQNCDALASIQVNEGNPSFCSSEGVLYSKNMDKLIKYPNAKKSTTFVVPPSVGIIDGCAFNCATNLCQLVIPASVTNCCGIAGCEALTAIYCFGDYPFRSPLFYIYNSNAETDARQCYGSIFKSSWASDRNIPIYHFPETLNWGTASYLKEWNNPLGSLEISGPSTINANSSNKYIGLGTFSSGHSGIGCKVSWMITEGAEYASISADGVVATGAVDATQIVKIKATTTLGGVTRNATKTVTLKP